MRIIHLSDIHFSAGDHWDPDDDQRRELLLDIERAVDDGGPTDGILVGGDIAFSGAREQFEVAAAWLDEARQRGGCPKGAVWTVPGNHDIDRGAHHANLARVAMVQTLRETELSVVESKLHGFLICGDGMINCLEEYNRFASPWLCTTSASKPHWTDMTLDLDGLDVCLTGLNSVLVSDTSDKPADHGDTPVLLLSQQQCELERSKDRVHIAFGHHPPGWIRDWERVEPFLRRAHLVLFGHEHQFRALQEVEGQTVTVFAGAVAPERREVESGEYVPSWNLITLTREDEDLVVQVDPRVWVRERTRFERHPDGLAEFRVRLDLEPAAAPPAAGSGPLETSEAPTSGVDVTTPDATPESQGTDELPDTGATTSPLLPGIVEVHEGVSLPPGIERTRLRDLAVRFMRQTPTRRNQIATSLGVGEGLADLDLDANARGREILRRVRNAQKIDDLAQELGND
jgi:hypothetical protein